MTETLRLILRLAERRGGLPVFAADDTRPWAPGAREALIDHAILKEIEPAQIVDCDGCIEQHALDIEIREYPTGMLGVAKCPTCGRVNIPLDRLRQWQLNPTQLARSVMNAIDSSGPLDEIITNRIWSLGTIPSDDTPRDIFIARGMDWPDAREIVRQAEPLRRAPAPLVLTYATIPNPAIWSGFRPAAESLANICTLEDGQFAADLSQTLNRETLPHADSGDSKWISVTQAAEKLIKVVDNLDIKLARGRVSAAATRGKFKTNGKKGTGRMIYLDSFSTWLLEQQEINLNNAPW